MSGHAAGVANFQIIGKSAAFEIGPVRIEEVDAAGLSMADVVLTDDLPEGLTYVDGSLATNPAITDASASATGQTLTINLGFCCRPAGQSRQQNGRCYCNRPPDSQ